MPQFFGIKSKHKHALFHGSYSRAVARNKVNAFTSLREKEVYSGVSIPAIAQ